MNDTPLNAVLRKLQSLTSADDLRYLERWLARELNPYTDLRGVKQGFNHYQIGRTLKAILDLADDLADEDQTTLHIIVAMLHEAYRPKSDSARGQVQIKTIHRDYPEIDFEVSKEKKTLVFVTSPDGNVVFTPFYFHYAYVRLYAAKGGADRKKAKLLSIYADRGMGKGGSGGYVAAALADNLIIEAELLDARHAGEPAYREFLDRCQALVGKPSDEAGQSDQAVQAKAAPTWKDLTFADQQLLDLFKSSLKDTHGVLSWSVRSKSYRQDRAALESLESQGLIELLAKERSQRVYHLTDAGKQV